MSQAQKRSRGDNESDDAPPSKVLKLPKMTLKEELKGLVKARSTRFSDIIVVRHKPNKIFYQTFERGDKTKDLKMSEPVAIVVITNWGLHNQHAHLKKSIGAKGVILGDSKAYVWFKMHQSLFDVFHQTTEPEVLYELLKKSVSALYHTFTDGMLKLLNERIIFMNDANEVVFFRYPFLKMDQNVILDHKNNTHAASDSEKKLQIATIGNMALIAQYRHGHYTEHNQTKFSYMVNALVNQKWSVYLTKAMVTHVDNNIVILQLSNFAWEQRRHDGGKLQAMANRVALRTGDFEPSVMNEFRPHNNVHEANVNLETCHSLTDFFHHLWDYGTFRKVSEAYHEDMSEDDLTEKYLTNVPLYRFIIFEDYEDVMPNVLRI